MKFSLSLSFGWVRKTEKKINPSTGCEQSYRLIWSRVFPVQNPLQITMLFPLAVAGSFLLPNGRPTPRCNMRAPRLLPEHQRHLHSPRRRSRKRDALHNPRPARELHHKRRPLRVLQLHHTQTGRLLRRRTPHMGPNAFLKPQLPFLHSHRPSTH